MALDADHRVLLVIECAPPGPGVSRARVVLVQGLSPLTRAGILPANAHSTHFTDEKKAQNGNYPAPDHRVGKGSGWEHPRILLTSGVSAGGRWR